MSRAASGGEEQLVPRKGSTSIVWGFFGFAESDADQKAVLCKECRRVVSAPQGNTTNLFNHLKKHHKPKYDECMKAKANAGPQNPRQCSAPAQATITATLHRATPYPSTSQRHAEITDAITFYLAKDMCPINTVNNEGFKSMVKTLDKKYVIPSRNYFSKVALPALYEKRRGEIEREITAVEYFATTTDLWSSRTMEPYLSLTIHYIDDDFTMKSRCLQTSFFPQDHTGEAIAQGLREALASWSLPEERQVCITTDNGSNVVKAASLNKWMRLQCFGHRLHLAIENAMKDPRIDRAVGICKKLVSSFSYSWRRKKELARAQKELKLPEHGLKTECPTRWGSRQAMIERVLEQQRAISQVLSSDRKARHLIPSWQDTEILEAIHKSLHPLTEFTDALSSEKYVSVSFVKPVLHLFSSSILKVNDDVSELTNTIRKKILTYLEEKYKDPETQELLDMASALDPRFKLRYASEDRVEPIQARLVSEMAASEQGPSDGGTADRAEDTPSTSKKKKTLGSFFKVTERASPAHPPHQAVASELQSYLQCADLDSEENPLDWWREHQRVYPRLSKLAKKYLSIPATSAPSERVFSTGGNIVTCLRSSLKPESVDRLVFLAKNL
ncbi:Zinc finger BED domain-containing protein 1 [Merluccius polli]|uniref:Zinc finger BED domain-containing protein 1 n=1 Tax=Merluccius polli TaxID=89951 RepID=A0AA47MH84_MERPO|nr:Zinc finger BED domain-containing protein 1 [Merluccius polli]